MDELGETARGPRAQGAGASEPPTRIGRFLVTATLGAGGMGVVYAARDPDLDRRVALKLLKPGLVDDDAARKRQLLEAQTLARLSHPHVVTVFEIGTHEGATFIAMELVEGTTLRRLVEERRPWREVLAIYLQAAEGLAAAHEVGVVHRDFKPENALVDGKGRVRVLDFGIARSPDRVAARPPPEALSASAAFADTSRLYVTDTGLVIGTPGYMAPEQIAGVTVDARADQFSFCVALWEALHGQRPFTGKSWDELSQAILAGRVREPPAGTTVPPSLRTILARGLAPDPADRWPSMGALADALRTAALPPRRRAPSALAIAGVATLLVAGGLLAWRHARRPAACRPGTEVLAGVYDDARRQAVEHAFAATGAASAPTMARLVTRRLDRYVARWNHLYENQCHAAESQAEPLGGPKLAVRCLVARSLDLRDNVDRFTHLTADHLADAASQTQSVELLDRCADLATLQAHDKEGERAVLDLYDGLDDLAHRRWANDEASAVPQAAAAVAAARQTGFAPLLAAALLLEGELRMDVGDPEAAKKLLYEAEHEAERCGADSLRARALVQLVLVTGNGQAKLEEANAIARLADAAVDKVDDPDVRQLLTTSLGAARYQEGRYGEALEYFQRALDLTTAELGGDDIAGAEVQNNVGAALLSLGRYAEAEARFRHALALREALLGRDADMTLQTVDNLAAALNMQGKLDEAIAARRRVVAAHEQRDGPTSPLLAVPLQGIGTALALAGREAEARPYLERALSLEERRYGASDFHLGNTLLALASVDVELGHAADAEHEVRRALAIEEQTYGPGSVHLVKPLLVLSDAEHAQRRDAEARAAIDRAIAIVEPSLGHRDADTAFAYLRRGELLLATHHAAESLAPLEEALAIWRTVEGEPVDLGDVKLALARALTATHGDRARARQLAEEAQAHYAKGGVEGRKKAEVTAWLAAHPAR